VGKKVLTGEGHIRDLRKRGTWVITEKSLVGEMGEPSFILGMSWRGYGGRFKDLIVNNKKDNQRCKIGKSWQKC